ncbi:peptidoglycan editing factor PgeF [Tepidimicrobium xylanilyticum]|uniref:Purine nucleoside phosphorylase n=1 Tax=Tepidimicrobium xylanilyticum TaxID=1123352 RepID=A0A1H2SQF4_9FIRM|nr:peptidoglycan editing factor PgeF [Tepidimicrobium xylanilyticum]GMG96161.1 hypothetical protein EN5CB1_09870 [Tepidimicrobium xylanilyticum]SDW33279.1 conserved hypothetical protein [Tepidimicrobium xylanilyticum]
MIKIKNHDHKAIYYQFERFNELNYISHLFTTKIGWGDSKIDILSDILDVARDRIISVKQVHGTDILIIGREFDNVEISKTSADGLITNIPNIVLTTYHADCVPLFFIDLTNKVVGLAHAGWKGTFENIAGRMLDRMKEVYGSDYREILVGIGPSIGSCCYEFGEDLADKFDERYKEFSNIIEQKDGKLYLDLWKLNYLLLTIKGIPERNIILSNICTSCNTEVFYSYRKEKGTKGRMIAAIGLV